MACTSRLNSLLVTRRTVVTFVATTILLLLGACNADEDPTAESFQVFSSEDSTLVGTLLGSAKRSFWYQIETQPGHGFVTVDATTGQFTYTPDTDFFGDDQFTYVTRTRSERSPIASVVIHVANVNDPPTIASIDTQYNSPESLEVAYPLIVGDVDNDPLTINVASSNNAAALVTIDKTSNQLIIRPLQAGDTDITVTVSDAQYSASTTFKYIAKDVEKIRHFHAAGNFAVQITNIADEGVRFGLIHNGYAANSTISEMVASARALPEQYPGEAFTRKLWRFVRDASIHDTTYTNDNQTYSPSVTLNSLGWGLCSHVAVTMAVLARAAGYDARAWALNGHIVPEVFVDGRWQMFDPDLGVYYKNRAGLVAGVQELALDPTLITNPVDPVFVQWPYPYRQVMADIFASAANKDLTMQEIVYQLASYAPPSAAIQLPPQSSLVYPGKWTELPTAFNNLGTVREIRQAALELPASWTGTLDLPWVAWDIQGAGTVRIANDPTIYTVGTAALKARLQDPPASPTNNVTIESNQGLRIVMFINLAKLYLNGDTEIIQRGLLVGGLSVQLINMDSQYAAAAPSRYIKGETDRF